MPAARRQTSAVTARVNLPAGTSETRPAAWARRSHRGSCAVSGAQTQDTMLQGWQEGFTLGNEPPCGELAIAGADEACTGILVVVCMQTSSKASAEHAMTNRTRAASQRQAGSLACAVVDRAVWRQRADCSTMLSQSGAPAVACPGMLAWRLCACCTGGLVTAAQAQWRTCVQGRQAPPAGHHDQPDDGDHDHDEAGVRCHLQLQARAQLHRCMLQAWLQPQSWLLAGTKPERFSAPRTCWSSGLPARRR